MGQVSPGSVRIKVQAVLRGASFALAIAAIVDDEHREAKLTELANRMQAVGDIPRVAVEVQQRSS